MLLIIALLQAIMPIPEGRPAHLDADSAFVASTPMFTFYSRLDLNLHDFLYMRSRFETAPIDTSSCYRGLDEDTKSGWTQANQYYRDNMSERHHRTDSVMASIRYRFGHVEGAPAGVDLTHIRHVLDAAVYAYSTCWWPLHDERNRAWAGGLAKQLRLYEDTLRGLIEGYLPESWPASAIHVDVVTYASWAGANTVVSPIHIMMSSADPAYRGYYALEMLFHEAAHDILRNANLREILPEPPRNLWHAILFYTVGETTRRVLQHAGVEDYTPYMFENGVFGSFHEPLREYWTAYLDGNIGWNEAVDQIAAAIGN